MCTLNSIGTLFQYSGWLWLRSLPKPATSVLYNTVPSGSCPYCPAYLCVQTSVFISHYSIVEFFFFFSIGCFILLTQCFLWTLHFPLLPAAFFSFFPPSCFRLLFSVNFFLTQNALDKTCTICLQWLTGDSKTVHVWNLTNQQITCWQGEMRKGCSNLADGDFWLHICNFTAIF